MAMVRAHAADAPPTMSQPADDSREPADTGEEAADSGFIRKLTKKEINHIRFLELRGMRLTESDQPDRVTVKVPQAVVDEFLTEMQGEPDFTSEDARREFHKLTPPLKLHVIAKRKGAAFADKVEIQSDPEVFLEFRKQIMPTILRGCATAGCHAPGLEKDTHFSLFKDPKKSPSTTYANFIVLTELAVNDQPVINRPQPENSLLLTYLLPAKDVKPDQRHPGKEELRPLFQSRNALAFRRIERWIRSLNNHPQLDYGVRLLPASESRDSESAKRPSEPEEKPGDLKPKPVQRPR
jgi:hypothetical protein